MLNRIQEVGAVRTQVCGTAWLTIGHTFDTVGADVEVNFQRGDFGCDNRRADDLFGE